ncbi:MAG: hypothetical protein E7052_04845 [Lentisphaerae bacterium]|nr:hypothetical protein [Lentisphaerota bacterium]
MYSNKLFAAVLLCGTLTAAGLSALGQAPQLVSKNGSRFFRESYLEKYPLVDFYPIDKAYGFVEPHQAAQFRIELKALPDLEYALTVKNELGQTVHTQKRQPCAEYEIVTIPGQERGYYIATAEFFVKEQKIAMAQSAFVSVPAIKGKRDTFFRINQFGVMPELLAGYRMIGAGSATLPIQTTPKGADAAKIANTFFGKHYKPLLDSDLEIHALFASGPLLKTKNMEAFKRGLPICNDDYFLRVESAVLEATKYLKGKVRSIGSIMEVPSHANIKHKHAGTWVEAMSQQFFISRIVAQAVRRIDPTIRITAGGCNIMRYIDPYEKIIMTDLVDYFDAYNIDAYFGSWNLRSGKYGIPETSLRKFYLQASELAASLGKSPLVENTEAGYNIHYGERFDRGLSITQAELTARSMIISKASPVGSVAIFRIAYGYGVNENDPMSDCMATVWKPGKAKKLKLTFTPLPGGAAYATFARELAFVRFIREIKTADNIVHAYVFKRPDGKTMFCAWTVKGEHKLDWEFKNPALHISMYGREKQIVPGKVQLMLTTAPFYMITDEKASAVANKLEKMFKNVGEKCSAGAKLIAQDEAMLFIRNHTSGNMTVQLAGKSLQIVPGKVVSLPVKLAPGQQNIDFTANNEKITAKVIRNMVKIPKLTGQVKFDGSGEFVLSNPTGQLTVPQHVRPVSALHPELYNFKSSMNPNGHDMLVKYRLAYDKKYIYLAAWVDDPLHVQRFKKDDLWRGDNLQFVFANSPAAPAAVRKFGEPLDAYQQGHNYSVALTERGTEIKKYNTNQPTQVKAKVIRKDDKTVYEIKIPRSEVGAIPGQPLYFNFVVFDNKDKTSAVPAYWLDMGEGLAGERDNALLPLVLFE